MGKGIGCALWLSLTLLGGLPAASASAQVVPVEAFAKASPFSMPRLSPTGEYLAVAVDFGDGQHAL